MLSHIYILLLAVGASFIQRTIGFGFGIFIMTALPFLMPSYGEAVTLSGLLALTSSSVAMFKYRKYVTWKRLVPILAAFLMVSTAAIFMLKRIEGSTMRIVLGLVLILISLYFIFFKDKIQKMVRPGLKYQIGTGIVSGAMGGLFGMQGPPVVLYLINSEEDKDHCSGHIIPVFASGSCDRRIGRKLGIQAHPQQAFHLYSVCIHRHKRPRHTVDGIACMRVIFP